MRKFLYENLPFYGPEGVDAGVDAGVETSVAPPLNEAPVDGPGSGRSTLRKQLESNVEKARGKEPLVERAERTGGKVTKSRARQEAEEQAGAESGQEPAEVVDPVEEEGGVQAPQTKAPEGWAKEAKAEWERLPPAVQTAVAKREADMAKGVEDLKGKYTDLDKVLQPRMDIIRKHGHTPAQAVNQMFAWFEALTGNPAVAFPALAQSFKFDLKSIPGLIAQQEQPKPGAEAAKPADGEVPPAVQKYIDELKQEIGGLKQGFTQQFGQLTNTFAQQSQAKTEEILTNWAKDKPHYEDVRRMMAHLIASQAVPPLPNGAADLDKAYDMAVYAVPEVRVKVLEEQQKAAAEKRKAAQVAEKAAQQEQANKARRANAGSLVQGAPGNVIAQQGAKKKAKSVRESIMEAREELAE